LNPLLNRLNIERPVIQAPMAGVQDATLALAVAKAGGLGSLPAAMLTPEQLSDALSGWRSETDRPLNVNFFCHDAPEVDQAELEAWLTELAPYYEELALERKPATGGRSPFSEAQLEVLLEFTPAVVSFHFGLPDDKLLDALYATGTTVISSATTVAEAVWLEAKGIHAIIAQGAEAGGHRGLFLSDDLNTQVGTMALLPQIVNAVSVPVIAAGGIADAAGVRAAQALGASAVQAGTSFLRTPEATTSSLHRAALADPEHTAVLTNVFTGRPARGLVNRIIRELGPISDLAPSFPLAADALAPLRRAAEAAGCADFTPLWSGQNRSGCVEKPAAEIVRALASGWAS
jgi:nitronate monooxygenase